MCDFIHERPWVEPYCQFPFYRDQNYGGRMCRGGARNKEFKTVVKRFKFMNISFEVIRHVEIMTVVRDYVRKKVSTWEIYFYWVMIKVFVALFSIGNCANELIRGLCNVASRKWREGLNKFHFKFLLTKKNWQSKFMDKT